MIFIDAEKYGILSELVSGAGSLIAAVAAISLGWRGRTKWEPSEQDVERGPQKVGSLLAAIAIAILWSQTRNPAYLPQLNKYAITLGIIAVVSLLIYGFMINTFTYIRIISTGKNKTREEKIIGGLWLSRVAKQVRERKEKEGVVLTTQDLLAGGEYKPDNVWSRGSRGLSKAIFVICYLGLTVSGTIAVACASIILGLSQAKVQPPPDPAPFVIVVGENPSFEKVAKMVEISEGPTISFNDNCAESVRKATVKAKDKKLYGYNIKDFLENLEFENGPKPNYDVRVVREKSRYEIACR